MFHLFTKKAIKVIMLAQEESRRLGHNFVSSEQILLGLIGEGNGIGARTLESSGVRLKDARIEVEKIIGRGTDPVKVEIPFVDDAKRVLELSWEEARKLGHNYIDTEHLLLGILRKADCVAINVMQGLGVNLGELENRISKLVTISDVGHQEEETYNSGKSGIENIKLQIEAWNNRAEMARQAGRPELVEQALEHKRRYHNELAKLQVPGEET